MQNQKTSCSGFMCPCKIKSCSFLMQNSISLFSLTLNICISHSAHLFFLLSLYSLILLHQPSRLNVFQLPFPFFHTYGCFFLLYVFLFHSSCSFQSRPYQTIYELWCKHSCMKWFSVLPAGRSVQLWWSYMWTRLKDSSTTDLQSKANLMLQSSYSTP